MSHPDHVDDVMPPLKPDQLSPSMGDWETSSAQTHGTLTSALIEVAERIVDAQGANGPDETNGAPADKAEVKSRMRILGRRKRRREITIRL
jgi:hypothetical protein